MFVSTKIQCSNNRKGSTCKFVVLVSGQSMGN